MTFTIRSPGYDLAKTIKSGQVFRYTELYPGCFTLYSSNHVCTVNQLGDAIKVGDNSGGDENYWENYFGADFNMLELDRLMTPNVILSQALSYSWGVHLLRQDPFECLINFIISQQKRIPQIQSAVDGLAKLCGSEIEEGVYAFPRPEQIVNADLSPLRLGYREDYVRNAAEQVMFGKIDLDALKAPRSTYQDAMYRLQNLYGVGVKVASCVALFSLGFTNAFPIDTHIQKVLALPEMQGFNPEHYGDYAGYVQQYIYNWALYNGY